jgi:ClpP class serine protease
VLHTPGGLVLAATQIARAVKAHRGKVTVFVPHYALSGGTLIALAADEIVMSGHAVLGPIDPQIGQMPAASLIKVTETKPLAEIDDQTLVLADIGRKAIQQVHAMARELLLEHLAPDKADEVAQKLSHGQWTHDYPIFLDEAKEIGLLVSTDMPKDMLELMALFPQPVRTSGGVEYLPEPRRRETPVPR